MYSSLVCKVATLILSACTVVLETSGTSLERSLKKPLMISGGKVIQQQGVKFVLGMNKSTDIAGGSSKDNDIAKKPLNGIINQHDNSNNNIISNRNSRHRRRRDANYSSGHSDEEYFNSRSHDTYSNITTKNDSVPGESDSFNRQPEDNPRSKSYKEPNRTRKMLSPYRHTTADRLRATDSIRLGNTVSRSPANDTETRDSETDTHAGSYTASHASDMGDDDTEHSYSEFTKRQNRPPWLDKDSDDTTSDEGDEGIGSRNSSSPLINVTAPSNSSIPDTTGSNVTESYQNHTHVTSAPGDSQNSEEKPTSSSSHGDHEAAVIDDGDNSRQVSPSLSSTAASSTPPEVTTRKDKRRRIRHQKNRSKKRHRKDKKRRRPMYKGSSSADEGSNSKLEISQDDEVGEHGERESDRVLPRPPDHDSDGDHEDEIGDDVHEEDGYEEEYDDEEEDEYYDEDEEDASEDYASSKEEENGQTDKETGQTTNCPTCGKRGLSEEEVKMLRLDMFTDLLAQKLRMNPEDLDQEAPAASSDGSDAQVPKLPHSVVEQMFNDNSREDEKEEFYAKDQEIIIPGEDIGRECFKKKHVTGCYTFKLEGKIKGEIAEAQLWFYKMRDRNDIRGQTFIVCELEKTRNDALKCSNQIAREDTFTKEDWVSMNVTRSVMRWVDKRVESEELAIRCPTCGTRSYKALYGVKEGYKPLLIIKYVTDSLYMRDRRSSDSCDPRSECCKRPLVVNFHAISMPSIIQPRNLSVGYCYGYCDGVDQFTYNHTAIKQRMRWGDAMTSQPIIREQLKACCVPLVLKDSFIITSEGGNIVRKILPKVIVERCGCM